MDLTEEARNFVPTMALPGEGMSIKRIPLPDDVIRLEALKTAVQMGRATFSSTLIEDACRLEEYIREGKAKPDAKPDEPGVWCIGPEESHQIMSISSEGIARSLAPKYPEAIYFFARLGN